MPLTVMGTAKMHGQEWERNRIKEDVLMAICFDHEARMRGWHSVTGLWIKAGVLRGAEKRALVFL